MKKTLTALLLALALLTGGAAAFSDVDGGLYYAAPIAWAVERGITTGTSESTFSPDSLCTRGQIITFLWRAAGSPEPERTDSPYGDVFPGALNQDIYKAILWACGAGITVPENPGGASFSPGEACDRAQAVLFLWRWSGSPEAGAPAAFTDVSPDADYAPAVAWAVENGITSGTSEDTFSPGEPCTRGQIVTFLYRCVNEAAPGEKVHIPEDLVPSSPEPEAEAPRPLQTYTGTGEARSLGLDGSEFTTEGIYDAEVTVDVYSPYEAVFTIDIPFPLYQACTYLVRFDNPEKRDTSYLFIFQRWDEAFADMIPWEDDHNSLRFVDTSGRDGFLSVHQDWSGDDRIGGSLVRRVTFSPGSCFTFDMLNGYTPSCHVSTSR